MSMMKISKVKKQKKLCRELVVNNIMLIEKKIFWWVKLFQKETNIYNFFNEVVGAL